MILDKKCICMHHKVIHDCLKDELETLTSLEQTNERINDNLILSNHCSLVGQVQR